ncbi:MAG: hypothetical protein AAF192_01100 [Pseudomonadota bacterium]
MPLRTVSDAYGGIFRLDTDTGLVEHDPTPGAYPTRFQRVSARALIGDAAGDQATAEIAAVVENDAHSITSHLIVSEQWVQDVQYAAPEAAMTRMTLSMPIRADLNNQDGIILEVGGAFGGLIVYQFDGMIYAQAGNGQAFGEDASRFELSTAALNTAYTLVLSADRTKRACLYVDDVLVATSEGAKPNFWGGDPGGLRVVWGGGFAANRGGYDTSTGKRIAIFNAYWFFNQVTWHVDNP